MAQSPPSRRIKALERGIGPPRRRPTQPLYVPDPDAIASSETSPAAGPAMSSLSIRIDLAPEIRVGPGKIRLLEAIAEHGSISAAGRVLGMSYRRAWMLVDELNRSFSEPVVEGQVGGRSGGGAQVTPFGERLIACYRAIERDATAAAARHLAGLQGAVAAS